MIHGQARGFVAVGGTETRARRAGHHGVPRADPILPARAEMSALLSVSQRGPEGPHSRTASSYVPKVLLRHFNVEAVQDAMSGGIVRSSENGQGLFGC